MLGTTLHQLGKYDLAMSLLGETFDKFDTMKQANSPVDMDIRDHRQIVAMMYRTSNNLGASYEMKYKQTNKHEYLVRAHNYYAISIENYDRY